MERFKIFILVLSIVSLSVFLDGCDKDEPLDEVIIPPLEEINPDNEKPDPEKPDPEPEKPDSAVTVQLLSGRTNTRSA